MDVLLYCLFTFNPLMFSTMTLEPISKQLVLVYATNGDKSDHLNKEQYVFFPPVGLTNCRQKELMVTQGVICYHLFGKISLKQSHYLAGWVSLSNRCDNTRELKLRSPQVKHEPFTSPLFSSLTFTHSLKHLPRYMHTQQSCGNMQAHAHKHMHFHKLHPGVVFQLSHHWGTPWMILSGGWRSRKQRKPAFCSCSLFGEHSFRGDEHTVCHLKWMHRAPASSQLSTCSPFLSIPHTYIKNQNHN